MKFGVPVKFFLKSHFSSVKRCPFCSLRLSLTSTLLTNLGLFDSEFALKSCIPLHSAMVFLAWLTSWRSLWQRSLLLSSLVYLRFFVLWGMILSANVGVPKVSLVIIVSFLFLLFVVSCVPLAPATTASGSPVRLPRLYFFHYHLCYKSILHCFSCSI